MTDPVAVDEDSHELAMDVCGGCGLAQLADDDTLADEPMGLAPKALQDQAKAAVDVVEAAGLLAGRSTVLEFGSPHGGTWIPLLIERGFSVGSADADVVLDSFGVMHEPDQCAAFRRRAEVMRQDGVLLMHYHPITTMVAHGQRNSLRHGHLGYYSLTTLVQLFDAVGMGISSAWEFDLYGGTVLVAASHGSPSPDESVQRILLAEKQENITSPETVARLQRDADADIQSLTDWLDGEARAGRSVYGYAAASKAVSLFSLAGVTSQLVTAVADASPVKQGRRMPGTDIPIVTPEELLAAHPDRVLLTLPDLVPEVTARYPALDGRWKVHGR